MTSSIDFQRFAFVIQKEVGRDPTISEWKASPSDDELARAICFGEYGDHEIVGIFECIPTHRFGCEITDRIALLIPAISAEAYRDGGKVSKLARDLMDRFELDDPANGELNVSRWVAKQQALMQQGWDRSKEARLARAL